MKKLSQGDVIKINDQVGRVLINADSRCSAASFARKDAPIASNLSIIVLLKQKKLEEN